MGRGRIYVLLRTGRPDSLEGSVNERLAEQLAIELQKEQIGEELALKIAHQVAAVIQSRFDCYEKLLAALGYQNGGCVIEASSITEVEGGKHSKGKHRLYPEPLERTDGSVGLGASKKPQVSAAG